MNTFQAENGYVKVETFLKVIDFSGLGTGVNVETTEKEGPSLRSVKFSLIYAGMFAIQNPNGSNVFLIKSKSFSSKIVQNNSEIV